MSQYLPLYLGLDNDTDTIIVLGNEKYLDGRRMELWDTDIVLIGKEQRGWHVNTVCRLPSYEIAHSAYRLAIGSATLSEALYQIEWVKNEHCVEGGDWIGYILHFSHPVHHARHYVGVTNNLTRRVKEHRNGLSLSSPLIRKLLSIGGHFTVATAKNFHNDKSAAFGWERYMKKVRKNTPELCLMCKEEVEDEDD